MALFGVLLIGPTGAATMTLGGELWLVTWKHGFYESSTTPLWGPSLGFSVNRFTCGANYGQGSFDLESRRAGIETEKGVKRKDLNVGILYNFYKTLNLLAGYKSLSYDYQYQSGSRQEDWQGAAFGLGGAFPLGNSNIFLVASMVYMPRVTLELTEKGMDFSHREKTKGRGTSYETGLQYSLLAVSEVPLGLSLTYAWSNISSSSPEIAQENRFGGLAFKLYYSFPF